ncbi:MAG: DUF3365 domain-containing protein, partial [Leptolyngbyaceae bacterium]|nr:DUF3365 domain-containing protein [Leptolyngbyaceae bacterium]
NTQAEQIVQERAEIVLTAMQSVRDYTQDNIQELVASHLRTPTENTDFFSQEIIPNFAARRIFASFKDKDPSFEDYEYKEAAVNPTNPEDQADAFEAQLFAQLQPLTSDPPERISGYRTLGGNKLFYLARPLIMNDASCLACHGHPSDAPSALIEIYGDRNGFGWNLNEIVATQMVYVPADMIFARGRQSLFTVAKTFLTIFGALFVTINLLLWRTVIRPLKVLTGTAKQISTCQLTSRKSVPSENAALSALTIRRDEPGQLARAFQYMIHVLRQREQDLQQAVDERTQSLAQEMRDRQAAQSALQTYSHAINHDLRNIVMGISSVVQGLKFRAKLSDTKPTLQEMPENGQNSQGQLLTVEPEAMTLIEKGCDRQLALMNTLMNVQSTDVWRLAVRLAPVDLRQLIPELIAVYQSRTYPATPTFSYHLPPFLPNIQADESQIQRVFENLIDNALKYNPDGVNVEIKASLIVPDNEGDRPLVRCAVMDNGVGVDPAKSQSLFQPYARGSRQKTTVGYGLGLYICREIITAHGGHIGVDKAPSGGAAFWFTLPLACP